MSNRCLFMYRHCDAHTCLACFLLRQTSQEAEKGLMKVAANVEDAPEPVKEYYEAVKGFDDYLAQVRAKSNETVWRERTSPGYVVVLSDSS